MKKEKKKTEIIITEPAQATAPLAELSQRIKSRETEIDGLCNNAVALGLKAIDLAFAQGDDLADAKSRLQHGEWGQWLRDNFPKDERTARRYMQLAEIPKRTRMSVLQDAKSINEAFRMLQIIQPEPVKQIEQLPSITLPPEVQKLNWIAEWVVREHPTFEKLNPLAREELKTRLKPVVDIYQKL